MARVGQRLAGIAPAVDEFASVDEARACVNEHASVDGSCLAHSRLEVANVGCSAIAVVDTARRAHFCRTDKARRTTVVGHAAAV